MSNNQTENRIVKMVFDNSAFKAAAAHTKSALDNIHQSVTNLGKNSGLLNVTRDMDKVAVHAGKMQVAVLTAVGTIANKVTNAAMGAINSLTFDPIKQGFREYGELLTKQNVIMNATGKSAKQVKAVLSDLNTYSDKTIYSFGNMTDALTSFINAGVPLSKASTAIKGVANAAAFAGATSEEANGAMRAFGQAMGTGFMGLQDWMQIGTAHMDTIGFKKQMIQAAEAVGTLTKKGDHWVDSKGKFVSATKGFRDTLKDQWATTTVLTKALSAYTDQSTKLGKKATEAATKVRTFGAFMDTTKEALGSGWANVFTALFGGLDEATDMWTGLSGAVSGVIGSFFKFTTTALQTWRDLGGFTKTVQGFKNILAPLGAIFKVVGDAWKAAFPGSDKGAGKTLYGLSVAFEALTRPLTWLAKLIGLLVHPLALFFQVIKFGVDIVKAIIGYIKDFAKTVWDVATFKVPAVGGFWGFIQKVGAWARAGADEIQKLYDKIKPLVDKISNIDISMPKLSLPGMPNLSMPNIKLPGIFGGGDKKVQSGLETVNTKVMDLVSSVKDLGGTSKDTFSREPFSDAKELYYTQKMQGAEKATNVFNDTMEKAKDFGSGFVDVIKDIANWFKELFSNIEGKDITTSLNFAVLATLGTVFAKLMWSITHFLDNFSEIGKSASEMLSGVGDALHSFQTVARAKLILNIAIALGILAASLWLLSRIPQDKLQTAFKGLAGVIVAFSVILIMFQKTVGKLGQDAIGKMYAIGFAIAAIGFGLLLMAGAMRLMKGVGIGEIIKTLVVLEFLFLELQLTGKLAGQAGRKMVAAAVSMVIIAGALYLLAGAMLLFRLVKPGDMVKVGLSLLAMTAALVILSFVPPGMLLHIGAAMLALATSMGILAVALIVFALVKWGSIAKAAVVLTLLTAAVIAIAIFGGGPVGASGIVALAAGLMIIAVACLALNKVNWSSIWKASLILVILVAAFALFMGVVYLAAPVIPLLTGLAFGMGAMAIGIALLVTALAAALPLLAAGAAAFGVFAAGAAVSIAVFLQTLATEAPVIKDAAIKLLKTFIDGIVESVPLILNGIKRVLKAIWDFFAGPQTTDTGKKGGQSILQSFREKLEEWTPKVLEAIQKLVEKLMQKLRDNDDDIVKTIIDILIDIINAIAEKADDFATAAANLIIKFMEGLGKQAEPLTKAGIQLIVDLINGIANGIRDKSGELGTAIANAISAMSDVGTDLVEGMGKGIGAAARNSVLAPWKMIGSVVDGVVHGAEDKAETHSPSRRMIPIGEFMVDGLTVGIQNRAVAAINAVAAVVTGQIATANSYISKYVQRLDQQSTAARAKAEGLAAAAQRAAEAASKTEKDKKDDAAAEKLQKTADKAAEAATAAEEKANKAKEASDRKDEYRKATTLEKAKMRSEDAQRQIDEAKDAERKAATELTQAKALEKQAASGKYSKVEADKMRKEAAELRKDSEANARLANQLIRDAKVSTTDALALQKKAGAEAAAAFQKQYTAEAKADADAVKFEKMTDAQKAAKRRKDAAALQKKADADLVAAKKLAYTDLDAANELAQKAMDEANQARDFIEEAKGYEKAVSEAKAEAAKAAAEKAKDKAEADKAAKEKAAAEAEKAAAEKLANTPISLSLTASQAAAEAFNRNAELYSDSLAAAAAAPSTIEFNQYNTSPEALSPTEVYRRTNNLLTQAAGKIGAAA